MRYGLGVDLGTTFLAAAVARPGRTEMVLLGDRSVVTPAVVYLREDGTIVTGDAANRWGLSSPDRLGRSVKRRLGDPTPVILGGVPHAVPDLLGAMLRDVVAKISAAQGGPPDSLVLTRPANWGPLRRELFDERVTAIAGLRGAAVVSDPEATAAHFAASRHTDGGEVVAVYDLGGGTFDAAVLRTGPDGPEMLGTPDGIERLGGIDFDDAILSYVNYRSGGALTDLDLQDPQTGVALARLRQDCVLAKEALSADTEASVPVFLPGRHLDIPLTRSDLEDMLRAPLESTVGVLSRALRSAGLATDELSAVVMVGGPTRIPLVTRMVTEGLPGPPLVSPHPDHAVALGAATLAARHLAEGRPRPSFMPAPAGAVAARRPGSAPAPPPAGPATRDAAAQVRPVPAVGAPGRRDPAGPPVGAPGRGDPAPGPRPPQPPTLSDEPTAPAGASWPPARAARPGQPPAAPGATSPPAAPPGRAGPPTADPDATSPPAAPPRRTPPTPDQDVTSPAAAPPGRAGPPTAYPDAASPPTAPGPPAPSGPRSRPPPPGLRPSPPPPPNRAGAPRPASPAPGRAGAAPPAGERSWPPAPGPRPAGPPARPAGATSWPPSPPPRPAAPRPAAPPPPATSWPPAFPPAGAPSWSPTAPPPRGPTGSRAEPGPRAEQPRTAQPDPPTPGDEQPAADGDWHAPSIGRMLVIGVALLALVVVIGLIVYVVISRLQVTASGAPGPPTPPWTATAAVLVDGGVPH